jgi:hypothetical protein
VNWSPRQLKRVFPSTPKIYEFADETPTPQDSFANDAVGTLL